MFAPVDDGEGAPSPTKQPPSKKKREEEGQPKDDHHDSDSCDIDESDESVGDCQSDEEEYFDEEEEDDDDEDEEEDDDEDEEDVSPPSHKVLEGGEKMVTYLFENNIFLLPSKELPQFIDINLIPQVRDSKNHPLIYAVVDEENDDLKIIKLAGATTNGSKREAFLKKSHPGGRYIILFQFGSRLDPTTHQVLMGSIAKLCKDVCTIDKEGLESMTIQQALDNQTKEGIPFTLNLLMHYINDRGAFQLRGLLKRFAIHLLESGFQEHAKKIEGELDLADGAWDCVQHEFLKGDDLLERAADKMEIVAEELNGLLQTLEKKYGRNYVEYLRRNPIVVKALSSWPPAIRRLGFTVVILDVMFGKDNWKDAFLKPPPDAEGEGDAYDTSKYTADDLDAAQKRFEEFEAERKREGMCSALDTNEFLCGHMGTTAARYLEERGWDHVDGDDLVGGDLSIYCYKEDDWEYPALIILHGPPCPIMNSNPKVKADRKWANTSQKCAGKIFALDELVRMLRTSDANESFSTDMNDYLVLGNILVMQCMIEYLVVYLHFYRYGASVIAKDFRVKYNVLCDKHTGLILKDAPRLYTEKTSLKNDTMVNTKLRNSLSQTEKDKQERINNFDLVLRKQLPDAETGVVKEREESNQEKLLRRARRKIGLDEGIWKEIVRARRLKSEQRIKESEENFQANEEQDANDFAAMLKAAKARKNRTGV